MFSNSEDNYPSQRKENTNNRLMDGEKGEAQRKLIQKR